MHSFKARQNEDVVCQLFYELIRNEKDIDSYLHMLSHWGGEERTFPTYYGFGTITGRITMRHPSIQNLRKNNRSVIIPDTGKRFLYVDYSQFEAGILASLSKDEILIKLYNTDIYSDLAEHVLGDKQNRNEAKIIFYRYMYGDDTLSKKAINYFLKLMSIINKLISPI
jgi:DNA polymerase I-like protein with 3'-5' exonuclease and polymerase domains